MQGLYDAQCGWCGEQVDVLRFLPVGAKGKRWRLAALLAGPGWVYLPLDARTWPNGLNYLVVYGFWGAVKSRAIAPVFVKK